jgi:hypothetical protein
MTGAVRSAGAAEAVRAAAAWLRTTEAVRARCRFLYDLARRGELAHFRLDPGRLDAAARYVADAIRANYPALDIPYHSRWRHFAAGGVDRWDALAREIADPAERARVAGDLAVVSVLLDAGAGGAWKYAEPGTGQTVARSEGLAVASLHMFRAGLFSSDPRRPLRADAEGLQALTPERLARGFQAGPANPLVGLANRCELLRRLGAALAANPAIYGPNPARPGNLVAHLVRASAGTVPANALLESLLTSLGPIWPNGLMFHGINLGDIGRHRRARGAGLTDGLVPFHKLSQWLAYSLLEPLEWAGARVAGLDALTGLPEYRNGGLFIDLGVVRPRPGLAEEGPLDPLGEPVVEWRALTVTLLDEIAPRVRALLGLSAEQLPLAKVLQGGTWTAGRRIAAERRPGGPPPLQVATDGTTF